MMVVRGGMRALVQFARATRHPEFADVDVPIVTLPDWFVAEAKKSRVRNQPFQTAGTWCKGSIMSCRRGGARGRQGLY